MRTLSFHQSPLVAALLAAPGADFQPRVPVSMRLRAWHSRHEGTIWMAVGLAPPLATLAYLCIAFPAARIALILAIVFGFRQIGRLVALLLDNWRTGRTQRRARIAEMQRRLAAKRTWNLGD